MLVNLDINNKDLDYTRTGYIGVYYCSEIEELIACSSVSVKNLYPKLMHKDKCYKSYGHTPSIEKVLSHFNLLKSDNRYVVELYNDGLTTCYRIVELN